MAKRFARWAVAEGIDAAQLQRAAVEAFAGQFEADLGGYLFKKRVARSGAGKSGGYRTVLGFRKGGSERVFFLYGFAKSARANISDREREALRIVAAGLIGSTGGQIDGLKAGGGLVELEQVG